MLKALEIKKGKKGFAKILKGVKGVTNTLGQTVASASGSLVSGVQTGVNLGVGAITTVASVIKKGPETSINSDNLLDSSDAQIVPSNENELKNVSDLDSKKNKEQDEQE